jgi:hypothetical protein
MAGITGILVIDGILFELKNSAHSHSQVMAGIMGILVIDGILILTEEF